MERGHRTESSGSLPEGLAGATSIIRTWQQLATLLCDHTCPGHRQWNDANASGTF